jgi:hypothetical protein
MAIHRDSEILIKFAAALALPSLEARIGALCALAAPAARQSIIGLAERRAADPRAAMTRQDCMAEAGWGLSTQIQKERSGALRSFLDGRKRLIVVDSFYEHLILRVILSNPVNAPALKGVRPRSLFVSSRVEKSSEAGA